MRLIFFLAALAERRIAGARLGRNRTLVRGPIRAETAAVAESLRGGSQGASGSTYTGE